MTDSIIQKNDNIIENWDLIENVQNDDEKQQLIDFLNKKLSDFIVIFWIEKTIYKKIIKSWTFLEEDQIEDILNWIEEIELKYPIVILKNEEKTQLWDILFYRIWYKKLGRDEFYYYKLIRKKERWTNSLIKERNYNFEQKLKNYSKKNLLYKNWNSYIINWWYNIKDEIYSQISVEQAVHFWVFWWTWSWKTVRVKSLLDQYCQLWAKMLILDKNLADYTDIVSKYPNNTYLYTSLTDINTWEKVMLYLLFLLLLLEERDKEFKKLWISNHTEIFKLDNWQEKIQWLERMIIVIDEFQSFRNSINKKLREKFDEVIAHLVMVSRSYGFNIIFSTQNFNAEVFPSDIRSNLKYQIWYMSNVWSFKSVFWLKDKQDEIIKLPSTYLFYDTMTRSFMTTQLPNLDVEINKETIKEKNNLINMLLEKLSKIELKTLDEKVLEYFWITDEKIIKELKQNVNYVFIIFYLNLFKETIKEIKKKVENIWKGFDFKNFKLVEPKYKNDMDILIYKFLIWYIEDKTAYFWKLTQEIKRNFLQKFNSNIVEPYFEDWNETELVEEIEEFLIKNIKVEFLP